MHDMELEETIRQAIDAGLLPATATIPARPSRPWPILILSAVGAWLLVIPLFALLLWITFSARSEGGGQLLCGLLGLAVAIPLSRSVSDLSFGGLFFGAAILASLAMLGFSVSLWMPDHLGVASLAVFALTLCFLVVSAWIQVALGAIACIATYFAFSIATEYDLTFGVSGAAFPYVLALLWCGLHAMQTLLLEDGQALRGAEALEWFCSGWVSVLLLLCVVAAGASFFAFHLPYFSPRYGAAAPPPLSACFALAAALWLAYCWTSLRKLWYLLVLMLMVVLAWLMSFLGAVLCVAAYCTTSGRGRMAVAAGVVVLWLLGSFYYLLSLPLTNKAAILAGSGFALLLAALSAWKGNIDAEGSRAQAPAKSRLGATLLTRARIGTALFAGLSLLVVNIGIVKNERTIAQGRTVFLALAPADPRSMMQGDYMSVGFKLEGNALADPMLSERGGVVVLVASDHGDGLADFVRVDDKSPLNAKEFLMRFVASRGGWTPGTNAWYFAEGEEPRWREARYGEFRVGADGKALLVALRGEHFKKL